MLEVGTRAPDFELPDQNGDIHTLKQYRGKKVILYFYPKDNTPGCTKQACNFGELYPQFKEKDAVVIGVSKNSVASHKNLKKNTVYHFHCLPILNVKLFKHMMFGKKNSFRKTSLGIIRATYLIDEEGTIEKAFSNVKAADNPAEMLAEI